MGIIIRRDRMRGDIWLDDFLLYYYSSLDEYPLKENSKLLEIPKDLLDYNYLGTYSPP